MATVALREIHVSQITEAVRELSKQANYYLPEDVQAAIRKAIEQEDSPLGRRVLEQILENAQVAAQEKMPLCQDCGMDVVFVEVGQDVHLVGGSLEEAIHEGIRKGYKEGYLRTSIVQHPFSKRINTRDNTPAIIYTRLVPGDKVRILLAPKGGGSENMSQLKMLKPADGRQGIVEFVVRAVEQAGANPCPPTIVGVGIGGTADRAVFLSKVASLRTPVGTPHPDPEVAELEAELLEKINALGIGPAGLGGRTTALAVHVETFPTHIATLPVAVNLLCHSARHKEVVL